MGEEKKLCVFVNTLCFFLEVINAIVILMIYVVAPYIIVFDSLDMFLTRKAFFRLAVPVSSLMVKAPLSFSKLNLHTGSPSSSSANIVSSFAEQEQHFAEDLTVPSSEEPYEDAFDEESGFDPVEAAAQEMHDLCFGMISYLRKADPEANQHLFQKRSQRRLRETVAEPHRRLLHGHFNRSIARQNNFASVADFKQATTVYTEMGEKLLLLLDQSLMDRLVENAGKCCRDRRADGVHKYRHLIDKASWRTFPHRWYRHAPFELQKLRADLPPVVVQNARFYRDNSTIRYLFALTEPQHPYREAIERRLFEISSQYDPRK